MREFQTHDGNVWRADLNLKVAYEVQQASIEFTELLGKVKPDWAERKLTLVDFSVEPEDKDNEEYMQILTNTAVLLKLSWFCVRDQARHLTVPDLSQEIAADAAIPQRPYTEDDYTAAFKGDTVQEVRLVMLQELADFIPHLEILFSRLIKLQERSTKLVKKRLNDVAPDLDSAAEELLKQQEKELNKTVKQARKDMARVVSGTSEQE